VFCWVRAQPTLAVPFPHNIHKSTRFRLIYVPSEGLIDTSHAMGELSPQNLYFGDVSGDNQVKLFPVYLVTEVRGS
jgi:hypothetical protein